MVMVVMVELRGERLVNNNNNSRGNSRGKMHYIGLAQKGDIHNYASFIPPIHSARLSRLFKHFHISPRTAISKRVSCLGGANARCACALFIICIICTIHP